VDAFTKWAEAFPLRSKEAEPIVKVLIEQVFFRFGTPVSLLSDQGKEVDGNIMKHVCRMLGIDKLHTSRRQIKWKGSIAPSMQSLKRP